jgi:hypothetical protein
VAVAAAAAAAAPDAVAQAPHAHARVVAAAERDARLERPAEAGRQADSAQRAHRRGMARHDAPRLEGQLAGAQRQVEAAQRRVCRGGKEQRGARPRGHAVARVGLDLQSEHGRCVTAVEACGRVCRCLQVRERAWRRIRLGLAEAVERAVVACRVRSAGTSNCLDQLAPTVSSASRHARTAYLSPPTAYLSPPTTRPSAAAVAGAAAAGVLVATHSEPPSLPRATQLTRAPLPHSRAVHHPHGRTPCAPGSLTSGSPTSGTAAAGAAAAVGGAKLGSSTVGGGGAATAASSPT